MNELESSCKRYLALAKADSVGQYRVLSDLGHVFYQDPRISRILEAALSRARLDLGRKDDLRHDVYIAFTQSVLPKLKSPESAIGALKMTAANCTKRLLSNPYDGELRSSISMEEPGESTGEGAEDSAAREDLLMGKILREGASDVIDTEQEERLIGGIMKERAKQAIEAALANEDQSATRHDTWILADYPHRPKNEPPPKKIPTSQIPTAKELNSGREPRYRELNAPAKKPTKVQRQFINAREAVALTVQTLAERLGIRAATLRAYIDLRVSLPPEISEAMDRIIHSPEGKARIAYHKKTKDLPMAGIIDQWMQRTGSTENRSLAEIIGTTGAVVRRWSRPKPDGTDSRPHPEDLFNYEQRILVFERARRKHQG